MVEKMVARIVNELLFEKIIDEDQRDDYEYAIICQVESFITIISILALSILAKRIISTIGFLISFFSLRKRTGGYHLNSFLSCYIGTLCVYGIVIYFCNRAGDNLMCMEILAAIASMCIFVIGTVNHPNMHMNSVEVKESKKAARLILFVELCIIVFLIQMKVKAIIISCCFSGIIVCAALLLIAKIIGQEVKSDE